jgi:hypothetical protein
MLPEPEPDALLLLRTVGMIDAEELEKLDPEDLLPPPLLELLPELESDPPVSNDGDED